MNAFEQTAVSLFVWTCQASFAASLLFLVVRLTQRTFGRVLGVSGCYALSLLVLARLFMPTLFPSRFSFMNALTPADNVARIAAVPELRERGQAAFLNDLFERSRRSDVRAWTRVAAPRDIDLSVRRQVQATTTFRSELLRGSRARTVAVASWVWLLGTVGFVAGVGLRQRRFRQWILRQETDRDARIEQLLEWARSQLPVNQNVRVILTNDLTTPALMGWWRPCLLLPRPVLKELDDRQLTMVLMHELAHIKRGDVLLNWVMIAAQSMHWFNPVIWAALRRLRAERELVCDAMVLACLETDDRRIYGGTLLKLLELFNRPVPCPTLLSVLNHKHEIKRRISMIPKFTPSKRSAWLLTIGLLAVFCALTFTRAADQRKAPATTGETTVASTPTPISRERALDQLRERLGELEARILSQQHLVDKLRVELGIPSDIADRPAGPTLEPETVRLLERERITSEAMAARYETLFNELKSKTRSELAQALPTALPDTELTQLLRDVNAAETQLAKVSLNFGPESGQVKELSKMIETVKKQIDARVQGILTGLAAQIEAQKAAASALSNRVEQTVREDAEAAQRYRPYFQARRELSLLEQVRDSLKLQYLQKQFGAQE